MFRISLEDSQVLVVNKQAGLVVHPVHPVHPAYPASLLNALLHYSPMLSVIPRAGLVHRLDKDTSGLMVVAKTLAAHVSLVNQLKVHSVTREYDAAVAGGVTAGGIISVPIGRHPVDRKRQAVNGKGKQAVTHFRVVERLSAHTYVMCRLETGRTHQIRVHLASRTLPLVGEKLYSVDTLFKRQALHARHLCLIHPASGEEVHCQAPLPADMQLLLNTLR